MQEETDRQGRGGGRRGGGGEQTGEGGRPNDAIGGVLEHQACRKHFSGRERLQSQETHFSDREADQGTSDFSGLKGVSGRGKEGLRC